MKRTLLIIAIAFLTVTSYCQSIQITQFSVTSVPGGINANLHTISFNGAGFIGSTYIITDNVIDISACFLYNMTAPVPTFENDIFIPISSDYDSYIVNVSVYNSSTTDTCNYISLGGTATATFLSVNDFADLTNDLILFPNPTTGILEISGNVLKINNICVYDQLGRRVRQLHDLAARRIELFGLEAGEYIIELQTDQGTLTKRVLLED